MNFPNITILTEAGKQIGLGHYTRCSSIYQALKQNNIPVEFVVYLNELKLNDPNIVSLNWIEKINTIKAHSTNDLVIVDSYLAGNVIYKQLKDIFTKVIAIDDYNRITYNSDWILNPNVFFSQIDYSNQSAKCIGGKEFVILRPEFREATTTGSLNQQIETILITIGGSDFRSLLPRLIDISSKSNVKKINVIAPEGLVYETPNNRVSILPSQDTSGMVNLIQQADIAISACGQTLHELASLEKPTIGICLDIDQIPNQKYYVQSGFLTASIAWDDVDIESKILTTIEQLQNTKTRQFIKTISASLINKSGTDNIVKLIKELSHANSE